MTRKFIYTEPFRRCWKAMGLGDNDLLNLHFENYNTFDTPLSWFISAGWYKGSKGRDNTQEAINEAINSSGGQTVQQLSAVAAMAGEMGLANAMEQYALGIKAQLEQGFSQALKWNDKSAWAVHIGARYDFTKALKLGVEFFDLLVELVDFLLAYAASRHCKHCCNDD